MHAASGRLNTICVVDLEKGSLGMAIQFSDYDFITIDVLTCYVLISSSVVQHMTKLQNTFDAPHQFNWLFLLQNYGISCVLA